MRYIACLRLPSPRVFARLCMIPFRDVARAVASLARNLLTVSCGDCCSTCPGATRWPIRLPPVGRGPFGREGPHQPAHPGGAEHHGCALYHPRFRKVCVIGLARCETHDAVYIGHDTAVQGKHMMLGFVVVAVIPHPAVRFSQVVQYVVCKGSSCPLFQNSSLGDTMY